MRILLTGGRGFIGRRLLPLLAGHDVVRISREAADGRSETRTIIADLTAEGTWRGEIERFAPDCCIHLAWDGLPDYSLGRCRVNLDANIALLETLTRARVSRVVVAGTCWEYGAARGPVAEAATAEGFGIFAATKHAIRTMLDALSRESGLEYRWARIFFAYGPGQREAALIPHLRQAYRANTPPSLREPTAVNDFIHVDDVARGLFALAEADAPSGVFNLGSGTPTSVGDVANRVARHYGGDEPFATGERGSGFWADTSKMTSTTGWRPQIDIHEGIERTLVDMDRVA